MSNFHIVSTEIHQTFETIIGQLIKGVGALLQRVQELQEVHRTKEASRISAFKKMERGQQQMQGIRIKANRIQESYEQAKQAYQQGMEKLEPSPTFLCPVFRFEKDEIRQFVVEIGEIVLCLIPDYSLKNEPMLTAGKLGSGTNELHATGIAFDNSTELIHIADFRRIQILTLKGEFLTEFENDELMNPWGIAVDGDCIIVTDMVSHALFQFRKEDFLLTNTIGTKGNNEGQLNNPEGLCIVTNGEVLVADCSNHRLSIFSKPLKFKCCIGQGQLHSPRDVKLSCDGIVVLDCSPYCVHLFSRAGLLLSSCVSRGDTQDSFVTSPSFFCLDAAYNIIISDWEYHVIRIFTKSGHHIHTLGRKGEGRGEFINPNYSMQCF